VQSGVVTSGIVTPEGVTLDFERAGIASRLLARLVDVLILVAAFYLAAILLVIVTMSAPTLSIVLMAVVAFGLAFLYPMILETTWRGRTVGKYAVGLRVITVEGGPVRFRHSAIRSMLQIIDIFATLGGAAVVAAMASPEGQRLGDMAAGTYVVRERRARAVMAEHEVIIPTPWGLQSIVDSIDPSSLDVSQAALIRSFLVRVPEMSDGSRAALAADLAARVSAVIGSNLPDTVYPETWLACVAARIQQHDDSARRSSLPPPPRR